MYTLMTTHSDSNDTMYMYMYIQCEKKGRSFTYMYSYAVLNIIIFIQHTAAVNERLRVLYLHGLKGKALYWEPASPYTLYRADMML